MPIRKVSDPALLQQLNAGGMVNPNPMFPGNMRAQQDTHVRTQQEIRQAEATAGATTDKTKADAKKAQLDLKIAQEAYDAAHPKGSTSTVLGPDSLKKLSPPDQEIVKALADGRLAFPAGFALKAPWWQQKLEQVAAFDPTFDATNFNNRAKARAMLLTGKVGTSANALNTSIGHLGLLNSQIGGTASHNFTPANAIQNYVDQHFLGESGITNFKDTAGKLASELTSVYRNGGGAEQDVVRQLQSLDPNASAKQKSDVIKNALDLLASKQAANLYQYNIGSGGKPGVDLLDPDARKVLDQFPDIRDKHFGAPTPGLSKDAAALIQSNGGTPPPAAPSSPTGFTPAPTGATGGSLGASSNGYDETIDSQSAALWNGAIRQGLSYRDAMSQWQSQLSGKSIVTPPDPDAYGKAVAYAQKHPNANYNPVESFTRTPLSPAGQATNAVAQSGPGALLTHAGNAALANIPQGLAGDRGTQWDAVSGQQHPTLSTIGDIAGTVAGSVGAGRALKAVAPSLGALGGLLTKTPGRASTLGDLAYGGVSGAAQNPDAPTTGAGLGMAAMGAGNVAGRYAIGPALAAAGDSKIGQTLANLIPRRGGGSFSPPAPLDPGQNLVMGQAGKAGIGDITAKMQDAQQAGLPYALADSDPRLRLLAGSASRKSPDVRSLAETVLGPRQMGQGERAIDQIGKNLAPVGDVPTIQAGILKSAQSQSSPLYSAAKAQSAPELTANPGLKEVLDRPAAQTAVRKGYETALNNGEDAGTLTYATDPNGNSVAYGNPSWNILHYARQELDKSGETAVRRALDNHIAQLNPGFKAADAKYAGIMKGSDALQAGADATKIGVTPEATQAAIGSVGDNFPHFQQGYASSLADQVERQRLTADPYNLIHGSLGQQAKMGAVFPQGADAFGLVHGLENDMSKTAQETLGGSPTASRQQSDSLFDSPMAGAASDIGTSLLTGGTHSPISLARLGLRLADLKSLGIRGAKDKADQIGPILLNTDPSANLQTLSDLIQMNAARKKYVGQARNLGGLIGAPTAFGLTQNR